MYTAKLRQDQIESGALSIRAFRINRFSRLYLSKKGEVNLQALQLITFALWLWVRYMRMKKLTGMLVAWQQF